MASIITPLQTYVANLGKPTQPNAWVALSSHPECSVYGFESTDSFRQLQSKLLAGHKSQKGSSVAKPVWMDKMIARVTAKKIWQDMTMHARGDFLIKRPWYGVLYPDKAEIVDVGAFDAYVPETAEELVVRWIVTKNTNYNYLLL